MDAYEQWKDRHLAERWAPDRLAGRPSPPLVAWTAFAAPEGRPLDVRVHWFVEGRDDARLARQITGTLWSEAGGDARRDFHIGPLPDVSFIEVVYDTSWRAYVKAGSGGPDGAPRMTRDRLVAVALALCGGTTVDPNPHAAAYFARLTPAGFHAEMELLDESLTAGQARQAFADRLRLAVRTEPSVSHNAAALDLLRRADGVITVGLSYGQHPVVDASPMPDRLLTLALADLDG